MFGNQAAAEARQSVRCGKPARRESRFTRVPFDPRMSISNP
jgi:hypothetical protein